MGKTLQISLIVIGALAVAAALLFAGIFIGRGSWGLAGYGPSGMMDRFFQSQPGPDFRRAPNNPYYNPGYDRGPGSWMGPGMMGGYGHGMMGGYGPGMMGRPGSGSAVNADPLSLDEATQAVEKYLERLNNPDLAIAEVMIFDNHAYAEIVEKSTGIGAMEVLVDPVTLAVYPEFGPNMMWNLKYSPMGEYGWMGGRMRGMMGGIATPEDISAEMPVTPDEAVEIAQKYLNAEQPGAQASDEADRFYGYYTLHIVRDGKVAGMLSVNGYTRQVFPHTWHGNFIEMSED